MTLAQARRYALSLPETTEAPHFHFGSWRVRGKIFATLPPGDALLHIFVADTEREQALALWPEWTEKLFWGKKVVGLRVTLGAAPAANVKTLLRQAWQAKAPKALRA